MSYSVYPASFILIFLNCILISGLADTVFMIAFGPLGYLLQLSEVTFSICTVYSSSTWRNVINYIILLFLFQIQHPRSHLNRFDLVITPQHDYYPLTPSAQEQVPKFLRRWITPREPPDSHVVCILAMNTSVLL